MKRRNLLVGLASGAVAGITTMGTGAFSSVEADRRFTVEVAHDRDAYLGLDEVGAGQRAVVSGGVVSVSLPGLQERLNDPNLGLGQDSAYEFIYDSEENQKKGLLSVTNQGTNEVVVYSENDLDADLEIELFDVTDSQRTALRDDPVTVSPGNHVKLGIRVRTFETELDTHKGEITIVAEEPDA